MLSGTGVSFIFTWWNFNTLIYIVQKKKEYSWLTSKPSFFPPTWELPPELWTVFMLTHWTRLTHTGSLNCTHFYAPLVIFFYPKLCLIIQKTYNKGNLNFKSYVILNSSSNYIDILKVKSAGFRISMEKNALLFLKFTFYKLLV